MFCYYEIKVQITELTLSNPFHACSHSPQQSSSIFTNFARVIFEARQAYTEGWRPGSETMVFAGRGPGVEERAKLLAEE